MFESSLIEKLKRIFDLDKVTFDSPGESQEQEGMFIDVEEAQIRIKDKRQIAKVQGKLRVFANRDKFPFGYLTKKIAEAESSDTKDLLFFDFEQDQGTIRNITVRTVSFVYFFDSQYDPSLGSITSVNLQEAE